MQNSIKLILSLVFSLSVAPLTNADPIEIKLPPETAKLRESKLPGYALATQKCIICHSVDYISYQPPNLNQAKWTAEVAKMRHTYGAQLSDDEVKSIGAYLAVAYGNARDTDASVLAASTATALKTETDSSATDVQDLLNNNACLGCHAIDKQLVGPAFRKIAAKYKNDPQALTKLSAVIRNGSVGTWGQVPMPPMSSLSDTQIKVLATYVLEQ